MKSNNPAIQQFFPVENASFLPLMFHFGEASSHAKDVLEMGTRFEGEESVYRSGPDGGGYDTD